MIKVALIMDWVIEVTIAVTWLFLLWSETEYVTHHLGREDVEHNSLLFFIGK